MSKLWKVLRIIGVCCGVLVLLAAGGVVLAQRKAQALLGRHFDAHTIAIPVPMPLEEEERVALRSHAAGGSADELHFDAVARERAAARGKHLVEARYGCAACHGADLAGGVMLDDAAIGEFRGPNLTSGKGGLPASYSISDWDRIVRHGIKQDGTPSIMPALDFVSMSDQELSDIVAYVHSLPPVDAIVAKPTLGPVGAVLLALGKLPLSADVLRDDQRPHPRTAPHAAETAEFGAHLRRRAPAATARTLQAGRCRSVHRAGLQLRI